MAAFVPLEEDDSTTPTFSYGARIEESHFLRIADELRDLPADIISPLPAYSLYQQHAIVAHHHTNHVPKHRLNSFESVGSIAPSHCAPSSIPVFGNPSCSSSMFPTPVPAISPYLCPGAFASGLSQYPRRPQQESFSTGIPSLNSPGLQLNSMPHTTTYDFSRHYFPLTPPVDDPKTGTTGYPFGECSTLLPVFSSLLPSPSVTDEPNPFTVSGRLDASTTEHVPLSPVSATSRPEPFLPTFPPSTLDRSPPLSSVISSGLARRRSRLTTLPSPSLSCTSIPPSSRTNPPKGRTSGGGPRSGNSRDEIVCFCKFCRVEIATLQLRKKGKDSDVELAEDFVCFDCRPDLVEGDGNEQESRQSRIGYHSSLSALLDREEGTEVQSRRRRSGSSAKVRRAVASRRDPKAELLTCDVCRWTIAAGELRPANPQETLNFTTEVICLHCSLTYRRCSDDGGGGGRLGVGKWRCKELFEEGRRNCSFSHARMGSIQDLVYDTHAIADIERDLPRLESVCFEFFRSSVLSALAVPDVLESEEPIAVNYEQIDKMASDSWSHFETFFRPCSDSTKRRFIGLRWASPTTRKKGRKIPASPSLSGQDFDGAAMRSGLRLTGFALMEVDIERSLLFTPLTMPMGSVGETFDASTTLLQHLSRRIACDLDNLNLGRRSAKLSPIPPIQEAWTAVLFSKDTRGANHLETRRGYLPLGKYVAGHEIPSEAHIESRMQEFVPATLQGGWRVFVRPYRGATDDWGELVTSRRRRKSVGAAEGRRAATRVKFEEADSDADYEEGPSTRRTKRTRS
ncbi:hypothetical protein JCM16303_005632 [Sporobolomyces ruberrimus]